jgi:cyclomaltodextrinase / maltogenic alpha-amylase / neopullulanase
VAGDDAHTRRRGDAVSEPDWVEHAIWWQVYPLGFTGADTTGTDRSVHGGLDQVVAWLDHAVALGASGLALGPVFASSTHGYDTVDHFHVDSRLGDDDAFDRLVAEAHTRGLRVLLDGVFDHVGRAHPWVVEGDARYVTDRVFEGHDDLVVLDHTSDAVVDHVVAVMEHWLGRGADGWRLDAAYAVPDSFWAQVLSRVRASFPEVYVVGEVIHGDYRAIVERSGMDSVTQYELWKAVWSSLHDANFFELAHALGRHDDLLGTFVPWTFVGNHDVTRIASQVGDPRHRAHADVVLFTVAGTPAVYYGDEYDATGVKEERFGGDDAVRPTFPPAPGHPDPDAAAALARTQELIGLRRRHAWWHRARTEVVTLSNTTLVYDLVADDARSRVLLNLADDPFTHDATGQLLAGDASMQDATVTVAPHGWAVVGA